MRYTTIILHIHYVHVTVVNDLTVTIGIQSTFILLPLLSDNPCLAAHVSI